MVCQPLLITYYISNVLPVIMQSVTYPYSKTSSLIVTLLPTAIILLSISQLKKFIYAHEATNALMILGFDFLFFVLLSYIIIKQLLPAFKGKIALEINSTGIISFAKNVTIGWSDIERIEFQNPAKASASLYITFKFETDHGNDIRIPLGFVRGVDSKIYETAIDFFKNSNR
ncbi:MAG: hypothetical protein ABI203_00335 [Mucilaginibacter sp.]